jgi:acetyltransferase-like isoleucine patch superfamily enzyme
MNKFIIIAAVIGLMALSSTAIANDYNDFKRIENNIRIESEGFGVSAEVNINDTARFKVGFDYDINKNVTVGPFVQVITDNNWNKQEALFGSMVSARF